MDPLPPPKGRVTSQDHRDFGLYLSQVERSQNGAMRKHAVALVLVGCLGVWWQFRHCDTSYDRDYDCGTDYHHSG